MTKNARQTIDLPQVSKSKQKSKRKRSLSFSAEVMARGYHTNFLDI